MKRAKWFGLAVVVFGLSVAVAGCTTWLGEDLSGELKQQSLLDAFPLLLTSLNMYNNPYYTDSRLNPFVPNFVGQCTWYAYGRIQEVGLVTHQILSTANLGQAIFRGNANTWDNDATRAGLVTGTQPRANSLAIWESSNHVAYVERVEGGSILVTESNYTPRVNRNIVVNRGTNLRSDPGLNQPIRWLMPQFTIMRVIGGPRQVDGYTWFQLQGNGYTGWAARFNSPPEGTRSCTDSRVCWNYTGISLQPASPVLGNPNIYIYLSPQLRVDDRFFSSRPQRQSFNLTGTGYTPNGQVRRFVQRPNGTRQEISPITADSNGRISGWSWTPQCTDAIGNYRVWTIDVGSGNQSNTITQRVTRGC
jgi:surface antigen